MGTLQKLVQALFETNVFDDVARNATHSPFSTYMYEYMHVKQRSDNVQKI